MSPLDPRTGHATDVPAAQALRLPTPADLGPNYFELFSAMPDADQSVRHAAVVGFGFSERAKLPDERIERDGPLSVFARITEHPTDQAATRFAAEARIASGYLRPDSGIALRALGLVVTLAELPPTNHQPVPNLMATRSLATGWLRELDGSPRATVLETWTVKHSRTVLTLILVWHGSVGDGWGEDLLKRLVHTEQRGASPGAA
jgi:hypothetical protein